MSTSVSHDVNLRITCCQPPYHRGLSASFSHSWLSAPDVPVFVFHMRDVHPTNLRNTINPSCTKCTGNSGTSNIIEHVVYHEMIMSMNAPRHVSDQQKCKNAKCCLVSCFKYYRNLCKAS